jgi:hypothetical protein
VLRRISGPKRDGVTGEWKKLHNGKLHNLYSSSDIIRQIKSRRMRWAGHVTRMGQGRNVWESPKEKDHLKDRGANGRMGGVWIGLTWLRRGTAGGLL